MVLQIFIIEGRKKWYKSEKNEQHRKLKKIDFFVR